MPANIIKPAAVIPETNFMQSKIQIIKPITLVEQIINNPTDLTAAFPVEEADGNLYTFSAYKKKDGFTGAVDWKDNDINTIKLDKLEMQQKTIIIDGEIIAGYQMKAVDLQSKGGKAVKVLEANTIACLNDIRLGIYSKVKQGLMNAMSVQMATADTPAALMEALQKAYDQLIKYRIITIADKSGWEIYVNEKTFNTIFGLNKSFTANADSGGANNPLFQGVVWGLDPSSKGSIKWNEIPFKVIDAMNFQDDKGNDVFKAFFMNASKFGRVVYINSGVDGGVWTYPLYTNTKDNLVAIKGSATVQFVPHVYVFEGTFGVAGDKSPFAWGIQLQTGAGSNN